MQTAALPIITTIQNVVAIQKNNLPGKVDVYTLENGTPTQELIFRVSGEVRTHLDGIVLENKPGGVHYLPKGTGKQEYRVETVEPGSSIVVFFDATAPLSREIFHTQSGYTPEIGLLFQKINGIWAKKDAGYTYEALSVFYNILFLLLKPENVDPRYRKIEPGVRYLNEHFHLANIDWEQVASCCRMSYSYFRRLFAACMGVSPARYVLDKKVQRARELLSSGQFNVTETAQAVGFSDLYYFSHVFKKLTGYAPSWLYKP